MAASLDASVHDTRSQLYTAQAQTIHAQRAIVAAARASEPSTSRHGGYRTVTVRWKAGGIEHTNTFISHAGVGVGDKSTFGWITKETGSGGHLVVPKRRLMRSPLRC